MDSATISALAAFSGAVIGGVTSFGTSWLKLGAETYQGELEMDFLSRLSR